MTRGGKRKGAGRPKKSDKRERLQITLPPDLLKQVRKKGNPSDVIESALVSYFLFGGA